MVRVEEIVGAQVYVHGVDLYDGTPVLDLKPWCHRLDIPRYDRGTEAVAAIRSGWYDGIPDVERRREG